MTVNKKFIFVAGMMKTGTSSMLAALNCYPEIFIMFEAYYNLGCRAWIEKMYRSAKPILNKKYETQENFYTAVRKFLETKGFAYKYFGDKVAIWDYEEQKKLFSDFKDDSFIIFMIRDIRTWLAKVIKRNSVKIFSKDNEIAEATHMFLECFLNSFKTDCVKIKMEDLANDTINWNDISDYIGCSINSHVDSWWTKLDNFDPGSPKATYWWKSRRVEVNCEQDIVVTLTNHKFWDFVLPIFDKYYNAEHNTFDLDSIDNDISSLDKLYDFKGLSCNDLYENIMVKN